MYGVIGRGYFGSDDIETTSGENKEVLRKYLPTATFAGKTVFGNAYKMSFKPYADCHIKINGGNAMFMEGETVFNIDYYDMPVESLVIVESGINFIVYGAHV